MFRHFFSLCFCVVLASGSCGLRAEMTQSPVPGAKDADEMIPGPFKLAGADVDSVLTALEQYTGRTILRTQALPTNTYTVTINGPIPKSELILALETLLELNNVGVTPLGDRFMKVVPLANIKSEAPELMSGSTLGLAPSGRIATKIFQLQFLRVGELFNQGFSPLFSPGVGGFGASVVVLEKANAAIVTDTVSNLQRIENLVKTLDQPALTGLTPKFYTLRNGAKASDVVNKMKIALNGPIASQIGSATTYSADDRTNQIILLADPRQYPFFDQLIGNLDLRSDPNTRNEVIYLKHADANTLAQELAQLVSGQNNAVQKSATQSVRPGEVATPTGLPPGFPNPQGTAGAPGSPSVPGQVQNALSAVLAGTTTASAEFSNLVTILADERANAVMISGTSDDVRLLKTLIEKLDIVLPQVRLEVIIAEVKLTDTDQSGLQALGLTAGTDTTRGTHITNFTGSVSGWDVTSGVVNPLAFQAALNSANAGQLSRIRILQEPIITATHAKQAEVVIGEKEPIITGTTSTPVTATTTTATNNAFATNSTVTYQDIAIDLKVTPYIGDDGNVQMTIDQTVDDIEGNVSVNGNNQPIIGHREATSYVSVNDGEMIVLGGLQKTETQVTHNKLGFLYEIPILSQLLGSHTDEYDRDELLLFIRPHVIYPPKTTEDTKNQIDQLSNKKDVYQFLENPGAEHNSKTQNLLNRFKGD